MNYNLTPESKFIVLLKTKMKRLKSKDYFQLKTMWVKCYLFFVFGGRNVRTTRVIVFVSAFWMFEGTNHIKLARTLRVFQWHKEILYPDWSKSRKSQVNEILLKDKYIKHAVHTQLGKDCNIFKIRMTKSDKSLFSLADLISILMTV